MTLFWIHCILEHTKKSLRKCKRVEINNMYSLAKMELNGKQKFREFTNMWKLKSILLNSQRVSEKKIMREWKYFWDKWKQNHKTSHTKAWRTRRKFGFKIHSELKMSMLKNKHTNRIITRYLIHETFWAYTSFLHSENFTPITQIAWQPHSLLTVYPVTLSSEQPWAIINIVSIFQ